MWQTECQSACGFILTVTESRTDRPGSGTRKDISALRSGVWLQNLPAFLLWKSCSCVCCPGFSICQIRLPGFWHLQTRLLPSWHFHPTQLHLRLTQVYLPTSTHSTGMALGCFWSLRWPCGDNPCKQTSVLCHPLLHRANLAYTSYKDEATHAQHHKSHTTGHLYSTTSMVGLPYDWLMDLKIWTNKIISDLSVLITLSFSLSFTTYSQ